MENRFVKINWWLYPITLLYGIGVWFRNKLFDWGVYKERTFKLPIISVGNITVGGTGKTPHTEYLIKLLQDSYQLAVLSRGYKRKTTGYILANEETKVSMIGDEPYQMKQKFPKIYMAVDSNRCHGIDRLQSSIDTSDVEVVILDDAFQHRYVKPGLNILLVDYNRMITEDQLLPAGRMREPKSGKDRANVVIITKCPFELTPMDYRILTASIQLYPYQQLFF
ncbi:MAG: tetraacyldisaccharide 4'-kinase, partial [Phocaeicola sp.]